MNRVPIAAAPSSQTESTEDLFLRSRVLELDVAIDRVPPDVVYLYQGWLDQLKTIVRGAEEPWIPIGRVGFILIFAHHNPNVRNCILPIWAAGRIKISPEKYQELAQNLDQQIGGMRSAGQVIPSQNLPSGLPDFLAPNDAIHFLANHFVMPRALRNILDTVLSTEMNQNLPPEVEEAVIFLTRQCPLVDLRLIRLSKALVDMAAKTFLQFDTVPLGKTSRYIFVGGPLTAQDTLAGSFEDKLRVDLNALGRVRVLFALASRERAREMLNAIRRDPAEPSDAAPIEIAYRKKTELVLTSEDLKLVDPQMSGTSERAIVSWVLGQAILRNSADVHFDYDRGEARFRLNVDGVLHTVVRLPDRKGRVVAGILRDISEFTGPWFLPESRRFSVRFDQQIVDFRAEGTPFRDARGPQMFTLRLLNNHTHKRTLSDLRIPEPHLSRLRDFIAMPYGLVLITGPTGSGKTTTMYSAIHEINTPKLKVLSVEDPIEQTIEGVDQVQVNEGQGVGFAMLLRSFLRSAPNVILVGEIRDEETAAISLQAANTGHLVIASLHTNTACGAINRLVDSFKLDPTILSDSVGGLQGQRLMRALCPLCKEVVAVNGPLRALFEKYEIPVGDGIYRAGRKPECPNCRGEGYSGRFVIMETVANGEELKEGIHLRRSEQELWRIARGHGYKRLFEEGLQHVATGDSDETELKKIRVVGY